MQEDVPENYVTKHRTIGVAELLLDTNSVLPSFKATVIKYVNTMLKQYPITEVRSYQ